jgi:hypothetical protein
LRGVEGKETEIGEDVRDDGLGRGESVVVAALFLCALRRRAIAVVKNKEGNAGTCRVTCNATVTRQ